jgi:hypothetical protein
LNARKALIRRLRRLLDALENADRTPPRSRVSTAYWARTHTVVHPERDLSEWVNPRLVAKKDWDSVVQGRNKH